MKESWSVLFLTALGAMSASCTLGEAYYPTEAFRIRDPYVIADDAEGTYYLYGASNYLGETNATAGVWVRKSRDLIVWSAPELVLEVPRNIQCVWAPEVHRYKGAYYMFATLKEYPDQQRPLVMMGPTPDWTSDMKGLWKSWHATWIYRAERPEGPFLPVSDKPITPPGWVALDGTLAVEDGNPYLVFTHDWAQVADGTIEIAPLKDDLTALAGPPRTIIRASVIAPGTRKGITDGPFVYRSTKSGKLFITWSTHNPKKSYGDGYCVVTSESVSGRLEGPWTNHRIVSDANGGHGMIFRTFDGKLKFALHQPEVWGREHARFLDVTDDGNSVSVLMPRDFDASAYPSVADAVADCRKAGGGRILVPRGVWKTGKVHLSSNCELHLEEGAELVFSDNPKDYLPAERVAYEGVECYNYSPLVYAAGATNVAVTGKGTLRAEHAFWYAWHWAGRVQAETKRDLYFRWSVEGMPVEKRILTDIPQSNCRPQFLHFNRCRGVRIEGVTVRDSPFWCIHTYACDGVVVRDVDVCSHIHNSDGIDLEMTKNALVEGCTFCQGDDAICVKAGKNADGRRVGICSENIEIRNCEIKAGHQLLALGSEVSAGIRNVWLHDCRMTGATFNGLLIKTNRERGGFVENIRFERVRAEHLEGAPVAIDANTYYGTPEPDVEVVRTRIRDVLVRDVVAGEAERAYNIKGDPMLPIERVTIKNVRVERLLGLGNVAESVCGLRMENVGK